MVSPWGWELYLFGSPQNPQGLAQFLIQGGTLQIIISLSKCWMRGYVKGCPGTIWLRCPRLWMMCIWNPSCYRNTHSKCSGNTDKLIKWPNPYPALNQQGRRQLCTTVLCPANTSMVVDWNSDLVAFFYPIPVWYRSQTTSCKLCPLGTTSTRFPSSISWDAAPASPPICIISYDSLLLPLAVLPFLLFLLGYL